MQSFSFTDRKIECVSRRTILALSVQYEQYSTNLFIKSTSVSYRIYLQGRS
jgi:hypothetical protein